MVSEQSAWGAEPFRLTDLVISVAQTRQPCLVTRVRGEELPSACSGGSSVCGGSACFAVANGVLGALRLAAFRVRRGDSDTRCVTFYWLHFRIGNLWLVVLPAGKGFRSRRGRVFARSRAYVCQYAAACTSRQKSRASVEIPAVSIYEWWP